MENYHFIGTPGEAVIDHVTGEIVGRFDESGQLDSADVAEHYAAPLIERIRQNYLQGICQPISIYSSYTGDIVDGALLVVTGEGWERCRTTTGDTAYFYLLPGSYTVNAFVDNTLVDSMSFTIVDSPETIELCYDDTPQDDEPFPEEDIPPEEGDE